MEKIGLVVDSTCYLDQATLEKHNIKTVSLNVLEGEDTVYKETEITPQFVLDQIDAGKKLTTAQPSPTLFTDAFDELFEEGYDKVLAITLSQGISGTYQSALIGKEASKRSDDVYVFNTLNAGFGNELMVLEVIRFIEESTTYEEVIARANAIIADRGLLFTVQNLFSLQKGGRLSRGQALLGTVLRIRPIIQLNEDGELKLIHKERTQTRLMDYFINSIKEHVGDDGTPVVRIVHQKSKESAEQLKEKLEETFQSITITLTDRISPVFSIHIGKKGLGVTWYNAEV